MSSFSVTVWSHRTLGVIAMAAMTIDGAMRAG